MLLGLTCAATALHSTDEETSSGGTQRSGNPQGDRRRGSRDRQEEEKFDSRHNNAGRPVTTCARAKIEPSCRGSSGFGARSI
jgi:hypothetical protein